MAWQAKCWLHEDGGLSLNYKILHKICGLVVHTCNPSARVWRGEEDLGSLLPAGLDKSGGSRFSIRPRPIKKKPRWRGWRNSLTLKSTDFFSSEPGNTQHPHDGSQPYVTPVLGKPISEDIRNTCDAQVLMHSQNIHTRK